MNYTKDNLTKQKRACLVEEIKKAVKEELENSENSGKRPNLNLSNYLHEKVKYNYGYMAYIFREETGITIQTFAINTKIDRVKELLINDKLTLTEISLKLHYSSPSHLSNQFRDVTGIRISNFLVDSGLKNIGYFKYKKVA